MPFSLGKQSEKIAFIFVINANFFHLGKRSCVAEPFVRKLLFIYIVSVLQKFAISTLNGEEVFDEEFNITIRPKGNVNLVFHLKKQSPPSDDPLKSTPE